MYLIQILKLHVYKIFFFKLFRLIIPINPLSERNYYQFHTIEHSTLIINNRGHYTYVENGEINAFT